jgi:hypothetical protein
MAQLTSTSAVGGSNASVAGGSGASSSGGTSLPPGRRAREVSSIGEGVLEGGKAFAKGLLSGAVGILAKPVEGIEKGGVAGFFEGVTKVKLTEAC